MEKNLTSRDFLRICSREILNPGQTALSDEDRWQQAVAAKSVRNFWFTASARPQNQVTGLNVVILGETPRFSEPIIITDLLSLFDFKSDDATTSAMLSRFFAQITRFGSGDATSGVNLFGLPGPVGQEMITKYEKNRSQTVTIDGPVLTVAVNDLQPHYLPFVPRLLQPYDFLQVRWTLNVALIVTPETSTPLQLGVRSVRVLPATNPYRYIQEGSQKRIQNYIAGNHSETFFMQVEFPFANIPARGSNIPFVIKTPQQGRPLLILGAVSNLEGCQVRLIEEESRYFFTEVDKIPQPPFPGSSQPVYQGIPLALVAPDSDFRNTNLFNMWPVPHLLEPDAQLVLELYNGLCPTVGVPGIYQTQAATRGSQNARITFVCRTV